jgi:PPE-repeat protein
MNPIRRRPRLLETLPLSLALLVAGGGGCSGASSSNLSVASNPDASASGGGGSSGGSSGAGSTGGSSGAGPSGSSGAGASSGAGDDGGGAADDGGPGVDGSGDDSGTVCPPIRCLIVCPYGSLTDGKGCSTCQCAPAPDAGGDASPGSDAGASCAKDKDCDQDHVCAYLSADACSATGACVLQSGAVCDAYAPGCACDGSMINTVCNGLPSGYVPKPLRHTGTCQ